MLYKNVLVPFDKSIHATHALETAVKLVSDDPEAKITVLYVADVNEGEDATLEIAARMSGVQRSALDASAHDSEADYREAKQAEISEAIQPIVGEAFGKVQVKVAFGKPHHAIINFAYARDCDLICMGCRGLNALRGMLGSVSYAVLRSSEIPVHVVK